jgi:predicted transcriptional regulator
MTETLTIRLDADRKKRLDALAQRSKHEEWRLGEIRAGLADLDEGRSVSHEKTSKWLKTWGKPSESKAPR